jgi:hypothetical protein
VRTSLPALLALSVLSAACPKLPGVEAGSSSSSGSTSGGTVGLESLCPVVANGFLRSYAWYMYGASVALGGAMSCESALSDDDTMVMLWGDVEGARAGLCALDGGMAMANVQALGESIQAGRVAYSGESAGRCQQAGRAWFASRGGLLPSLVALSTDGGVDSTVCNEVARGLQPEGQPCRSDLECAPVDGGTACVHRLAQDCEGVCQRLGRAGDECETRGEPGCVDGLSCITPGDGRRGVCVPPAPAGQPCVVDGGELGCVEGSACVEGHCIQRLGVGSGCTNGDECQDGLACTGTPAQCTAPGAEGEVCQRGDTYRRPCLNCLVCLQDADAGDVGRCGRFARVGEDCAARPCIFGLTCMGSTCRPLARRGETCGLPDGVDGDDDKRGNCLNPLDTCTGSPATCQPRAQEGQPCVADPTSRSVTGSCASGLTCARPSPTATTGTCLGPALGWGAPCGRVQDLPSDCVVDGTDASVRCSTEDDGGRGACMAEANGPPGAPCRDAYHCARGHYCAGFDGGAAVGTCQPGGAPGSPCGYQEPWQTTCQSGFCDSLGADGGFRSACQPFRGVGAPCSSQECQPDLRCIQGQCAPGAPFGGTCTEDEDCASGTVCAPEGQCAYAQCVAYNSCGGCGGCTDGSMVPFLLFFGLAFQVRRTRRGRS